MTLDISTITILGGFCAVGFAGGLGYFAALRHSVDLFVARRCVARPSALTAARLAVLLLALGLTVHAGAGALFASLSGLMLARTVSIRAARRVA